MTCGSHERPLDDVAGMEHPERRAMAPRQQEATVHGRIDTAAPAAAE
jgi:hypothetical protein